MTFPKSHLLSFIASSCLFVQFALGQVVPEKCGTVAYDKILKERHPKLEDTEQFEKWMKSKLSRLSLKGLYNGRSGSPVYIIPVVVHIIHNGEAVGTGANISDAQVQSQIDVLNEDFPRLNDDAVNTPAEFLPVAGSIDIEFVLAKQDPEGLPTDGILRVVGTQPTWAMADNNVFKALSYWPAEDYLNIWVVKFQDPSGLIAYAQLPVSSLPGLEDSSNDALTDGVASDYRAFGVGFPGLYPAFNKGRTATHEIGHFFGLRHIWGDVQSCSGTDYCNDTPTQLGSTSGCIGHPSVSCGHNKMFQNYMDYTDDACMNLFTVNQVDRMIVILGESPRRASLLESLGATEPVAVADDLGIKRIITPEATSCPSVTPSIVVRNYGTNTITSAQLKLAVNGSDEETKNLVLSLAPLDSSTIVFSPLADLNYGSTNQFVFNVVTTNGVTDGKVENDSAKRTVLVPVLMELPMFEQFTIAPSTWNITNPDGLSTWTNVTAPSSSPTNKAMYMNFYDYESIGESDIYITPVFDLTTDTAAILKFDRAYATISSQYNDGLKILVTTGCDFEGAIEIFNKEGLSLATVPNTSTPYLPSGPSDWITETLSLTQFLGQPNVQVAFIATNDYGNNLYLDNVRIITGNYTDLVLDEVKSPSPVTCVSTPTPILTVKNNGSTLITDFTVNVIVNGTAAAEQNFSGFNLDTGEETNISLSAWSLVEGTNTVNISIINPNEVNPADNMANLNEVVSFAEEAIPLREDFNSTYPDWTIVSEVMQSKWASTQTNKVVSLVYDAYYNGSIGNKSWLVSPTLDFSKTLEASLFFDLSYAKSSTGNERFQVLLSTDCGQTFPHTIFDKTGDQIADTVLGTPWTPHDDNDWNRFFINLDTLTGNPKARIAFVVTNGNGNNLFIDNIEIFVDDNPHPVNVENLFSVYNNFLPNFKITFNLPERETVRMQIFNPVGQVVIDNVLPDTLNQTYDVDLNGQMSGIYLVRLMMGNLTGTAKVYVPR